VIESRLTQNSTEDSGENLGSELVRVLQKDRSNKIYTYREKDRERIFIGKLANLIMNAKSHNGLSPSWRNREASSVAQTKSDSLRTRFS
jgi:hypothetical protein